MAVSHRMAEETDVTMGEEVGYRLQYPAFICSKEILSTSAMLLVPDHFVRPREAQKAMDVTRSEVQAHWRRSVHSLECLPCICATLTLTTQNYANGSSTLTRQRDSKGSCKGHTGSDLWGSQEAMPLFLCA
ncbi:hypothetical protein VNO77_03860 [Canavalia gladiata]|uniref:Uncharacterized protein n=1 Tax=Canavalia gladiata TaxID=3824 RepID=A0AAN9N0M2_CANGL